MMVGIYTVDLFIYEAHSLKDKRRVIKSILDRCHHKFRVSISEVGDMDLWQKAVLGFAFVATDRTYVEQVMEKVVIEIEKQGDVEILHVEKEII